METVKYYLLKGNDIEDVKSRYIDKILINDMYSKEINEELITIEQKYYTYVEYNGMLHNQKYFIHYNKENKDINSMLDLNIVYKSKDYILNNININDAVEIEASFVNLVNLEEIEDEKKKFIDKINDLLLTKICNINGVKPSRHMYIDISLIENFKMLEIKYIYEPVYIIRYRDKTQNKDYVSIYSSYHDDFYSFDFVKSNEYIEYRRKYSRSISYIPKEFIDLYYTDSFKVYIQTINRLRYSSKREILRKIRINTKYIDNLEYKEYLYMGIYYFKIKKYLKKIKINSNDIRRKIYLSYLCLYHNENAGIFLYECGKLGILNNCKIGYLVGLLKISYSLGSLEAKKLLYEHYSLPRYYDEYFVSKYS